MSTKIYNGIKFKTNNLYDLLKQLQNIKQKAIDAGIKYLCEYGFIDDFIFENSLRYREVYSIQRLLIHSFSAQVRRDSTPPFLFSIFIFPHKNGDLYGYFLNDNIAEYTDILLSENIAEDFHYQNQSDKPDTVSDEEWRHRREIWEDLLKGAGVLNKNGFSFPIVQSSDLQDNRIFTAIETYINTLNIKDKG